MTPRNPVKPLERLYADELWETVREQVDAERRKKQAETRMGLSDKKLSDKESQENTASHHLAQNFNTNRTYADELRKQQ